LKTARCAFASRFFENTTLIDNAERFCAFRKMIENLDAFKKTSEA
jgi:hypothetical protein